MGTSLQDHRRVSAPDLLQSLGGGHVLPVRCPMISRKWRTNWTNLTPFFDYPPEIRKVMYTTNSIEAINSQLRKVTRKRGAFPTPESVRKVLYLAILKASERWTRPVQDWPAALNHLALVFPGRVNV